MEDAEFLDRVRKKIENRAGRPVEVVLAQGDKTQVAVDFSGPVPRVILGADALEHPGLARMGIEYAVACLRKGGQITPLEFFVVLRRN